MKSSAFSLLCLIAVAGFAFATGAATLDVDVTLGNLADFLPVLPEEVSFYLYTQKNPSHSQQLYTNDGPSIIRSNFNSSLPTRFIIHGWISNGQQDVNTRIRDAYLSTGPNNIIVVDWVEESVNVYQLSVKHVPGVAKKVAEFIDFMVGNGWIKLNDLTIIGHSLGAHVAGNAARSVQSGQVHTVVGLDPAQLDFKYSTSTTRLRSTDAYYVESIQTTAGGLGYVEPIGRATFYPNGGVNQPGCLLDLLQTCGHFRAYIYFAEAIMNGGFPSIQCNNYTDAVNMRCGNLYSPTVRMGDPRNADLANGVYYVPVHAFPPYSY